MASNIDPRIEQILNQIEIYQEIAAKDYNVPAWQALPIASNPDIAFRPQCTQLDAIWQATDTAWVWEGQVIHNTPGQGTMTPLTALEMQAAGVCLTGSHAVDVPLVATNEIFQDFVEATSSPVATIPELPTTKNTTEISVINPTEPNQIEADFSINASLILGGLILIGGGIYFGFTYLIKSKKEKVNQVISRAEAELKKEPAATSDKLEYDFEL